MYYESDDGIEWRRPGLDISRYDTYERTNILLDLDTGGTSFYTSVLVVPDAPGPQRYQMFVLRRPGEPEGFKGAEVVRGFSTLRGNDALVWGLYRYYSSDGCHWQPDVGPVLVEDTDVLRADGTSDGIFIYREVDGSFVAYHKTRIESFPGAIVPYEAHPAGCRVLVRRTSADGTDWSPHEPCILPDWRDQADTQFMELSVTPINGGYVGLLTVYRTASQTIELQFAASRDGRYWWRPDRRACVAQPPLGDHGGGMMWGTHHMIGEGDFLHYYYTGLEGIHGDMFSTEEAGLASEQGWRYRGLYPLHGEVLSRTPGIISFQGALCRATWRKGRLWALTTASGGNMDGFASTSTAMDQGEVLNINASTVNNGGISAELVGDGGRVPPGFGRDDCDGFSGDASTTRMTWRGNAACPADGLRVRFVLRSARLYGFEFTRDV